MKVIVFVCSGNTFRSRVAEAYLKSKKLYNIEVSSCGTDAKADWDGSITWWCKRVIKNADLVKYESRDWKQVTKEILTQADLVIFIDQDNYKYCHDKLGFNGKYQVWNISDVDLDLIKPGTEVELSKQADNIFLEIKTKVDELVEKLSS